MDVMTIPAWLEATKVARAIGDSVMAIAVLSAVHLLGVTLVGGGALVTALRLTGLLLPGREAVEITRPAGRGVAIGAVISVTTGLLLVAPRATTAVTNDFFRLKMTLLVLAAVVHLPLLRAVASAPRSAAVRLAGAAIGVLWFGVIGAGCAFILLE